VGSGIFVAAAIQSEGGIKLFIRKKRRVEIAAPVAHLFTSVFFQPLVRG